MSKRIPLAVVGAGRFGKFHIKSIKQHPLFDLLCVVDVCPQARAWAAAQGYPIKKSIEEIPEQVEAAVIAVPSSLHEAVAVPLLDRGIHLLVEKPLATTLASLEKLLILSAEKNCILCTGHIERFNRPVSSLTKLPNKIECIRYSTAEKNNTESFLDLMIHDIDLVAVMLNLDPARNFEVSTARLTRNGAEVFANIDGIQLYFLAKFNAERSYATVALHYNDSVEYLEPFNFSANAQDPLTQQYNSFYNKLEGKKSDIADGIAGMTAARRAIQISAML